MTGPTNAIARALSAAEVFAREEVVFPHVALSSGVTATLDSVICDNYQASAWDVVLSKAGATSQRRIYARHNGTSGADATTAYMGDSGPDDIGTVDVTLDIDLNGTGTSQLMRLRATAASSGWTATLTRVPNKPPQP